MRSGRDELPSLDFQTLEAAYAAGAWSPSRLMSALVEAQERAPHEGVWIERGEPSRLIEAAKEVEARRARGEELALFGLPFAVKDSIDVAGVRTTVACPDFAYVPERSAPVVERLLAAGALYVGKTNLDQFATGLVGTRSPYGSPANPFDARFITGGSSSGSAAAVARGEVSFALGTDTAGSGRVPAAFTNIVGFKPSRGRIPATGVVPACRSVDCVSVFALTCEDAAAVVRTTSGDDGADPYAREPFAPARPARGPFTFGCPEGAWLAARVDAETLRGFGVACRLLEELGGRPRTVDLSPFLEAGSLLYGGPWIAERLVSLGDFVRERPGSVLDVTRQILLGGARWSATEAFAALHRLKALGRSVARAFTEMDLLLLPTTPTIPKIEDVLREPIRLNERLGTFTTFANLLDLAAVAVPCLLRADGLPMGVSLLGLSGSDEQLTSVGGQLHRRTGLTLGATGAPVPEGLARDPEAAREGEDSMPLAVVGAHLRGQPLHGELVRVGATWLRACRTSPRYRLFALPRTTPRKPGLVRAGTGERGAAIEVEVWRIPKSAFGAFLSGVKAPLVIGTIELEDGTNAHGFLCEGYALEGATEISHHGGWRAFLGAEGAAG